jgi:hypothetical protein
MQVQGVDIALMLESAVPSRRCLVEQGHHVRRFKEEEPPVFNLQELLGSDKSVVSEPVEDVDKAWERYI